MIAVNVLFCFLCLIGWSEEIGLDLLNGTLTLIRSQSSINSQRALNITSSIQDSLNSLDCSTPASLCNCDSLFKIAVAAAGDILLEVSTKLDKDTLSLESSQTLFIDYARVVQSSLKLWKISRSAGYKSIMALEVLIARIVSGIFNTNNSNVTLGDANSTMYSESVLITPENEGSSMTFPINSLSAYSQRVVVPSEVLLNLANDTNTTNTSTLITTTIVGNSSSNYLGILSVTFTQKSGNFSKNITQLSKNISVYFPSQSHPYKPICLFFNSNTTKWSSVEINLVKNDMETNNIICTTNHLGTFTVEFTYQNPFNISDMLLISMLFALLFLSLIALFIALILFAVAGKKFFNIERNGEISLLYFNQTLALFLATAAFIIFTFLVSFTSNDSIHQVFFSLAQYFWLAVLAWNLCLGIYSFYRFFIDVFNTKRRIWRYLMVLGWGFPLPFVIAAIAVTQTRTSTYVIECSTFNIARFLLQGPICLVIIVNMLLFIVIIFRLCQVKCKRNNRTLRNEMIAFAREILVESILMTFVLGLPWVVWALPLVSFLTTIFQGEEVSMENGNYLKWILLIYGIPGIVLLIIVVLKYRSLSKKNAAYSSKNNQANSENAAEAVRITLPKPKPRRKLFTIKQGSIFSRSVDSTRDGTDSFLSLKLEKLRTSLSIKLHANSDKYNSINEVNGNVSTLTDNQTVDTLHQMEEGSNSSNNVGLHSIPHRLPTIVQEDEVELTSL